MKKILVMVKQVPDTASVIRIREDGKGIVTDGLKWVLNPYDEFALEEALRTRESQGGEVIVVSLGPVRVEEMMRQALAMGADRGIHVIAEDAEGLDAHNAAQILAKVASDEGFDVIFTGKQAVDDDLAQTGVLLAQMLDIPQVTIATKLEWDGTTILAERELEGGLERVETTWPVVITAQRGLNTPRYPTLPNIMKAKKKEIKKIAMDSLGLNLEPYVITEELVLPPKRTTGRILTGDPRDTAQELARLLHEEVRII